jgi:hypothetical protein
MPIESKIIGQTKGYPIVIVGLIFGLIQAIATIPMGGGYLFCIIPGGIIGGIGFIVFANRNKLPEMVKKGAMIAAALMFLSVILSIAQISMFTQAEQNLQDLQDSTNQITSSNWEEKKAQLVEGLRDILNIFVILITLLAAATALIAISCAIPPLKGNDRRKSFFLIPLIIAIAAIIVTPVVTELSLSNWRDALDDFEAADTQQEYEDVIEDFEEHPPEEIVLGSQIGGTLNFIAILMVLILSYFIAIEIETEASPVYYPPYQGYPPGQYPPQYPQQPPQYPQQPQYPPPPQQPQYPQQPTYTCPTCGGPITYYPQGWYCHNCRRYL